PTLYYGGEQDTGAMGSGAGDERFLGDVENAIDDQAHAPVFAGIDHDLDGVAGVGCPGVPHSSPGTRAAVIHLATTRVQDARHVDQGQDLVAVLDDVLRPDSLQGRAGELLQPGHLR